MIQKEGVMKYTYCYYFCYYWATRPHDYLNWIYIIHQTDNKQHQVKGVEVLHRKKVYSLERKDSIFAMIKFCKEDGTWSFFFIVDWNHQINKKKWPCGNPCFKVLNFPILATKTTIIYYLYLCSNGKFLICHIYRFLPFLSISNFIYK